MDDQSMYPDSLEQQPEFIDSSEPFDFPVEGLNQAELNQAELNQAELNQAELNQVDSFGAYEPVCAACGIPEQQTRSAETPQATQQELPQALPDRRDLKGHCPLVYTLSQLKLRCFKLCPFRRVDVCQKDCGPSQPSCGLLKNWFNRGSHCNKNCRIKNWLLSPPQRTPIRNFARWLLQPPTCRPFQCFRGRLTQPPANQPIQGLQGGSFFQNSTPASPTSGGLLSELSGEGTRFRS